ADRHPAPGRHTRLGGDDRLRRRQHAHDGVQHNGSAGRHREHRCRLRSAVLSGADAGLPSTRQGGLMRRVSVGLVLYILAAAGAARAQIFTGDVIGTARDESGAVLPGVTVTLTSPAAPGGPLTTVTSEKGEYRFTQLNPGSYTLELTLSGF